MPHDVETTVAAIRQLHKRRRFAMKVAQKLDLSMQAFVRINATDWRPDMLDKDRERIRKQVSGLIAEVRPMLAELNRRKSELTDPDVAARLTIADVFPDIDPTLDFMSGPVDAMDKASRPSLDMRKASEKAMTKLARQLPGYVFVERVRGAGDLGFATIIGETGDLSNYATVSKVWKRLGFAPYDGHAGSTWKRESWRPRKLTAEEWTDNPFASERYALMRMIADSLFKAQWIGKAKTEDGKGKPNGPYGEVYAKRAAHTAQTHPEWTPAHVQSDALRVMMKQFLADLCGAWWADAPRVVTNEGMSRAAGYSAEQIAAGTPYIELMGT